VTSGTHAVCSIGRPMLSRSMRCDKALLHRGEPRR
jgi:hypothetical protein